MPPPSVHFTGGHENEWNSVEPQFILTVSCTYSELQKQSCISFRNTTSGKQDFPLIFVRRINATDGGYIMLKKVFLILMASVVLMTCATVHLLAADAEQPTATVVEGDLQSYSIDTLVDGIYGTISMDEGVQNFANGTYMGVLYTGLTVDIDYHEVKSFDEMSIGFLHDGYSWGIDFPESVKFEISMDGSSFEEYAYADMSEVLEEEEYCIYRVVTPTKAAEAQYVRITIVPRLEAAWFFMDEFSIHEIGAISLEEAMKEAEKAAEKAAEEAAEKAAAEAASRPATTLVEGDIQSYSLMTLVDGVYGTVVDDGSQNFANGTYMGVLYTGLTADFDLREVKTFDELSLGFLKDGVNWGIEFPASVKYEISLDGTTFEEYAVLDLSELTMEEEYGVYRAASPKKAVQAQYIRITVTPREGAAWFFMDELSINETEALPAEEVTAPVEDETVAPAAEEVTAPAEEATAPAEEDVPAVDAVETAPQTVDLVSVLFVLSAVSGMALSAVRKRK